MEILLGLTMVCLNMNFVQHQCEPIDLRVDGFETYYFTHNNSYRVDVYEEGEGYYRSSRVERCFVKTEDRDNLGFYHNSAITGAINDR